MISEALMGRLISKVYLGFKILKNSNVPFQIFTGLS